jgi:rhamnulokinase
MNSDTDTDTVRVLKNITGLWIFEECRRTWREEGFTPELAELIALAEKSTFSSIIDPNNLLFSTPGDMPHKVSQFCRESNQPEPHNHGDYIRCIFISLALAYKKTLEEIEEVTGKKISKLHILGGGSQIDLLNQMAADATGCVISAGPTESTLIGNVAMQAIASGEFANLTDARKAIKKSLAPKLFMPQKH